jgi:hypothetical protein
MMSGQQPTPLQILPCVISPILALLGIPAAKVGLATAPGH